MEKINYAVCIFGLQQHGKSHRAMHRAVLAARGEHPAGLKCRVFVQDPTNSFGPVAPRYESPRDWAAAAATAVKDKKPFAAIARFRSVGAQALCDMAEKAAAATRPPGVDQYGDPLPVRVPSIVVFDEGGAEEAFRDNYMQPWFRTIDLERAHKGIGWILLCQDGAIHRDLISKTTEIDVFRLTGSHVIDRIGEYGKAPPAILAAIPKLEPHNYHSGSPHNPESWR